MVIPKKTTHPQTVMKRNIMMKMMRSHVVMRLLWKMEHKEKIELMIFFGDFRVKREEASI